MNTKHLCKALYAAIKVVSITVVLLLIVIGTAAVTAVYVPAPWNVGIIVLLTFIGILTYLFYETL